MILLTAIGVIILFILHIILFRNLVTDSYRQSLFEIRADLFELAKNNSSLGFNSVLYKQFEYILNNSIRVAHLLSFWQIVISEMVLYILGGKTIKHKNQFHHLFQSELNLINDHSLKEKLEDLCNKYYSQTAMHVVFSAPIASLVIIYIISWYVIQKKSIDLFNKIKTVLDYKLQSQTVSI